PAIGDAVRACGMPAHPDEERPVVAVVGRPPVLRRRHHLEDVPLQRLDVEGPELFCVVEVLAHRVGPGRLLVENLQVQLIRPPVPVRPGPSRGGDYWVLAFAATVRHVGPSPVSLFSSLRSLAHFLESIKSWGRSSRVTVINSGAAFIDTSRPV